MAKSLWGQLPNPDAIRTPHTILAEQAEALTEQTQGLLVGTAGRSSDSSGNFESVLRIVAPALNDYTYTLLKVRHTITLYPLSMEVYTTSTNYEFTSEAKFLTGLQSVLSSPEIHKFISGLLAQIRA